MTFEVLRQQQPLEHRRFFYSDFATDVGAHRAGLGAVKNFISLLLVTVPLLWRARVFSVSTYSMRCCLYGCHGLGIMQGMLC